MTRRKRKKRVNKKKIILYITIIIILIATSMLLVYKINNEKQLKQEKMKQENLKQNIINHYNEYVKTNKETDIYTIENSKYIKIGKIGLNQELILEDKDI